MNMLAFRHRYVNYIALCVLLVFAVSARYSVAVQNVTIQPGTITYGDDVILAFEFEQAYQVADCWVYLDVNQSETVDPFDLFLLRDKFWDNDGCDEDPVNYQYARILDSQELYHIPGQLIAKVEDGGSTGYAALTINPLSSFTSISGTVTRPANTENLIALFFLTEGVNDPETYFTALTDASGDFTIHIADDFTGLPGALFVLDYMDFMPKWTKSDMEIMTVTGHIKGQDVQLNPATAWVYGRVEDEAGLPLLDGYSICAKMDDQAESGVCDNGWYHIGLVDGEWNIEGEISQLHYDFMVGQEEAALVSGDSIRIDLVFYSTNSTISGTVYLDEQPYSRTPVVADYDGGFSVGRSDNNGEYEIYVSNRISGYNIYIDNDKIPAGYYVQEKYEDVTPGASNIDFHLVSISGGISGTLSVEQGDPVPDYAEFMVWGEMRESGVSYSVEVFTDGTYELRMPEGVYDIRLKQPWPPACGEYGYCWIPPSHDSVLVYPIIESGFDFELNYAHARIEGELSGLSQAQELMIYGWEGTTQVECRVADLIRQDFTYELRLCEGTWHLIPPEVESYNVQPQSYTVVVEDKDTLFTGCDFEYTPLWVSPEPSDPVASEFQLGACFPNPFNASVVVTYKIPEAGMVTMIACNVLGQRVAEVFNRIVSAGVHEITWTPEDLAAGIYFLELTWKGEVQIAKVMYVR